MKRLYEAPIINTALSLITALGAYVPSVKVSDPSHFAEQQQRNKRRTRPIIGRGKYGKGLEAHFAKKRLEMIQAKAAFK